MKNRHLFANAVLWAAAILASALLDAPPALTLILLPALASSFILVSGDRKPALCASAQP